MTKGSYRISLKRFCLYCRAETPGSEQPLDRYNTNKAVLKKQTLLVAACFHFNAAECVRKNINAQPRETRGEYSSHTV